MAHRSRTSLGALGCVLLASATGSAQPSQPPAAPAALPSSTAPESAGQRALALGVLMTPKGPSLRARVCRAAPCPLAEADSVELPVSSAPDARDLERARITTLAIARDRHVIHIDAGESATRWQAIVAAPVGTGTAPVVVWSGRTAPTPMDGSDSADAVQITEPASDGTVRVLVGQVRPGIELCGRTSLLSPRVVHAPDLSLKHVKLQRLSQKDRDGAVRLQAAAVSTAQPAPLAQLLAVQGASSAIGSPLSIADRDPNTVWSEGRGGEGRGEFVTLRAPSEVPLVSLTFTFRPPSADVEEGAGPQRFWLATTDRVFEVSVPEDPWKNAGTRYEVRFPEAVGASCLTLVLGDAYVARAAKDARVTVAEVEARSEWDGATDARGLVAALAGGGDRARSAAQVLLRGGEPAQRAALEGYGELDEAGRQLVLDVLDNAPCDLGAPLYASVLASRSERVRTRAQDRVRRCGRRAAPALAAVLDKGPGCIDGYDNPKLCRSSTRGKAGSLGTARLAAGEELASVAPLIAVQHMAPLLGSVDAASRGSIRASLARATRHEAGRAALGEVMRSADLPAEVTLDLLRSVQDRYADMPSDASAAFARVATPQADERLRYLLCEPAARLAALGHQRAASFLYARIVREPSPMVRLHAVEVAARVPVLRDTVMYALEDQNVRVRLAAARALDSEPRAASYLQRRLMIDEWPVVRASAARSLAAGGGGAEADDALARSLLDRSHGVRASALLALGERGARNHAAAVRERAEDSQEPVTVRIQAVRALGRMCDPDAASTLTIFARRSENANSPEAASGLGRAAIVALGRLHPADLQQRLEPLLSAQRVSASVRAAAEAALRETDTCTAPTRTR